MAQETKPPKRQPVKSPLDIPEVTKDKVICFALYAVHNRVLKLTAQLYPLDDSDPRVARLEVKRDGQWRELATAKVIDDGWTATFRVEKWDAANDVAYRVAHGETAYYEGLIRRDPIDKDVITVAAFTGNSIYAPHGGDIPRDDIVENIKRINPDLLFFSGDQVYDHKQHYAYWLKFGRDFGEIIRQYPTITIPDDHDVGQPNIWGASGKLSTSPGATDGGYAMPVEYVKQVERAQTSHLPDPFDPTPIQRGIGVYYTNMTVGGVSFAIIEDRKFKTGPEGLVPKQGPRPDHIDDPNYDPKSIDVKGAELLGERQLKFLRQWGADWHDCEMKAVLSQTIFCGGAHIHGKLGGRLHADLDSNGWPQTGRNQAIAEIRRCFAVHIAGDQHLGTIFHHGIDEFRDSCYSLCVPSIANLYLRWWAPLEPGKNRVEGLPDYTGDHFDGLGNRVTCWAAANPSMEPDDLNSGPKLTTRAAGFGVAKFNKRDRTITFELWPRNADVTDPKTKQYEGWPLTIKQQDNYGRKAVAWLPTIETTGYVNPVIQVVDPSSDEIVYTLRISGTSFRPKVFRAGKYVVKIGDGNSWQQTLDVMSVDADDKQVIKVLLAAKPASNASDDAAASAAQKLFPMETSWGEIQWRRDGLDLVVKKLSDNLTITIPRLNNPMVGAYLKSDKDKTPLTFKPEPDEWLITLPEAARGALPVVVALDTVGAVFVPKTPRVVAQAENGEIVLPAHDAVTHGKLLRYEPQPHKNTVGYWANADDWVEWHFHVDRPGTFDLHVLQGCGAGQGGSEVRVSIGDRTVDFIVEDTGHFQNFKDRTIGRVEIKQAGDLTLNIKPVKKAANAVMDVRQVRLLPVKN